MKRTLLTLPRLGTDIFRMEKEKNVEQTFSTHPSSSPRELIGEDHVETERKYRLELFKKQKAKE